MQKITPLDLTQRVRAINDARRAPLETMTLSTEAGRYVYNVGNWFWEKNSCIGWDLVEVASAHGSERTILWGETKAELFDLLGAILTGIDIGKNSQQGQKK